MNTTLGRLGSFIAINYAATSLAKSPSIEATGKEGAASRYQNYEDFDAEWHRLLIEVRRAKVSENEIREIRGDGRLGSFIAINYAATSLAKSPSIEATGKEGAASRYQNYEDFDAEWHRLLIEVRRAKVSENEIREIRGDDCAPVTPPLSPKPDAEITSLAIIVYLLLNVEWVNWTREPALTMPRAWQQI
ncbi:hypothetical protein GJ496_000220 [Pomphorhynchus laevis]|nr:hypothetical protein GJ496_000220 [Pomphorhynchus laevis]